MLNLDSEMLKRLYHLFFLNKMLLPLPFYFPRKVRHDLRNPQQLLGNKPPAVLNFSLQCQMGVMVGKFVLNQLFQLCMKQRKNSMPQTAD